MLQEYSSVWAFYTSVNSSSLSCSLNNLMFIISSMFWYVKMLKVHYMSLHRFIKSYEEHNISIWGLTTQNEPSDGLEKGFSFNAIGWTPEEQVCFSWIFMKWVLWFLRLFFMHGIVIELCVLGYVCMHKHKHKCMHVYILVYTNRYANKYMFIHL